MDEAGQHADAIADRYGFRLPSAYWQARDAGLLVPGDPRELLLTDLEWLTPDEILDFEPSHGQIKSLLPVAQTARGDLWCWHTAWDGPETEPMVFCPRDLDTGEFFAHDWPAFLYRLLLEEFSGSWLVQDFGVEGTAQRYRGYVDSIGPFIPQQWADTLRDVCARPFKELQPEVHGYLSRPEAEALVGRDLKSPSCRRTFKHYV